MPRFVAPLAVCSALAVLAMRARAQLVAPDSGARVRIGRVNEGMLQEGSFVSASADSFSLKPGGGSGVISLPIRSIRTLDVSSGRHMDAGRMLKSAAVGAGIGIVATAGITLLCATAHSTGDGPGCAIVPFVIGGPLTLAGIIAGTVIGAGHPVESWTRVYDRESSTGIYIGPAPRGRIAIGMTVAFGGPPHSP